MPRMKSLAPVHLIGLDGNTALVTPEGAFVPDSLVPEAERRGCVREDAPPPKTEGMTPRRTTTLKDHKIIQAVKTIKERGDADDLLSTGAPKAAAVAKEVGERVSSAEINTALDAHARR